MKIRNFGFPILDFGWAAAFRDLPAHAQAKSKIAFSLVEVLAAVALIGIITFLALPNIVRIKQDSEESLAIARAEAINLSMASYLQALGQSGATADWGTAADDSARYTKLAPYLAYAPSAFADYMPAGYGIALPMEILDSTTHRLAKVPLTGPGNAAITY